MPPFEDNKEGKELAAACKRLGLHPFPIPMLRNSVPNQGRPACIRNRTCVGFACPVDGKNGTHNTVIPAAIASGNCEVRVHCQVAEVLSDASGRVTGIHYFDEKGKGQTQSADLVILAASATETARLLLNSATKLHPHGLGNNNDWVGRNLQGHAYTGAQAVFDHEITDFAGPGATFGICDYNHHNEGIIGGGLLCNEFNALPYLFAGMRPPGAARWGREHKDFQMKNIKRVAGLHGPIQEIPDFGARVQVDPSVRDYWGIPVVALSGSRHPLDYEHCKWLSARAEEILIEAGAVESWQRVGGRGLSGGQHQAGTARMGDDPQTSVCNRYGQVHGIDNLFVADGSLFVTNAGFNPVLTIMAIGYWVSDYINRTWTGTGFKS
jgi:choline dehydrogenase-like flavoprotein